MATYPDVLRHILNILRGGWQCLNCFLLKQALATEFNVVNIFDPLVDYKPLERGIAVVFGLCSS